MNVFQLSRQFKQQLLEREGKASAEMLRAYGTAYQSIQNAAARVTAQIEEARQSGEEISPGWLFRERRLDGLMLETRMEMARFSGFAAGATETQQQMAVHQAQENARQLTMAAMGLQAISVAHSWNRLPIGALQSLVGTLQDGSPLSSLFDRFGPDAAEAVKKSLIASVATGQSAKQTARSIRMALSTNLTRALTISRTETLRAYREASIRSYAANSDVVERWRWTATKSIRTCAMCIAMDGQEFDFETPFGSHPNCRCMPIPVTKSWEKLGIEDVEETKPTLETGTAWFERQPESVQAEILGPEKFSLFQAGQIKLSDLVGYKDDPQWGPVRFEKSLQSVSKEAQDG